MRPKTDDDRKPLDERKSATILPGHGTWHGQSVRHSDSDGEWGERQKFEPVVWDEV